MPVVRVPLVGNNTQRTSLYQNKDFEMVNMMAERIDNPVMDNALVYAIKRPGLLVAGMAQPFPDGEAGKPAMGVFYWDTYKIFIGVWGQIVYMWDMNNPNTAPLTYTRPAAQAANFMGFTEYEGEDNLIFMCDGVNAIKMDKNRVITVVTAVPNPHIAAPVYLDGYIFLVTPSGKIFNSKLDDMTQWPTDNYITAEMYPDKAVWLERQLNQIVAFGTQSVEYFYDAANPTGSPLRKTEHVVIQTGTQWPRSVSQSNGVLGFVGVGTSGGNIVGLIEGFRLTQISTAPIERHLDKSSIYSVNGAFLHVSGHFLFVITTLATVAEDNVQLVYDIKEKMWYRWTSALFLRELTVVKDETYFQIDASSKIYYTSNDAYTDAGNSIQCHVRTSKWDGGNVNRKFFHRTHLVCDTSPNHESNVDVAWTDDDYVTFSKQYTVDINKRPVIYRCGNSRRRAWNVYYQGNGPFRLESLEVDYDEGGR